MNKVNPFYFKIYRYIAIVYFFIITISVFINIPYVDSYYYWLWSKSPQLSYFDGPPMIAYVIRLFTIILGNSVLAVNTVGVVIVFITYYVIIQIVDLLVGNVAKSTNNDSLVSINSSVVALLWLTSYSVTTHRIINFVTYDGLVNLFELIIVMFVLKYIQFRKNYYIYLIGFFAGCALLSKYSAIILILTVVGYFLYNKELRVIFKKPHVYLAILLCTLVFSPVLIWNYQHQWKSFIYQLSFHSYNKEPVGNSAISHMIYYIKTCVLDPSIPLLVILLFLIYKNYKQIIMNKNIKNISVLMNKVFKNKLGIKFIFIAMLSVCLFWLCMSISSSIPDRYLLLFHTLLIIIMGIILLYNCYHKLLITLIICNAIWSIGDIISHSLKIRNPYCYSLYIETGLLKFDSPLAKYITIHHNASNYCYTKIRQDF